MLDEWPLEEPPARASASAGARATLAQTNSARRMRQFINRLDIALPAQKFSRELNVAQIWGAVAPAKHPLIGISAATGRAPEATPSGRVAWEVPTDVRLIAEALVPKYFVVTRASGRYRVRFAALAHRRGEAHVTAVAVQFAPALGVRPFRTCAGSGQQDFERRISSL